MNQTKLRTSSNFKMLSTGFLPEIIVVNKTDDTKVLCTLCGDINKEGDYFLFEGLRRHLTSSKAHLLKYSTLFLLERN